ncbi:hypothetical protein D0T84_01185 [Dysgonomonas sp. 521]|uniref:hypothetical protein n=1 Tax=Dysgonomonas sp. 521 TaxID=2302932 RepID=UPI0013D3E1C2|nr:hypothetical protein [Dysgonomonas sp. 521]NDV93530.1 hypothetical protein [Dysgonomonas sp. 521]
MSNYYNINYSRIGVLLLPTFLRQPIASAFIRAIMQPLDNMNDEFNEYRESLDIGTYSQVCYLQGLINDNFDPLERRIRIRQAALDEDAFLFWKRNTNKPVRLYKRSSPGFVPRLMSRKGFIGTENPDFEIVLPVGFTLSENEETYMRALINQNKLASKTYIITNG